MFQQVTGFPPNIDSIVRRFPEARRPNVIFAYGDVVYVPSGEKLPPQLVAHEAVHCERQLKMGVEKWWACYLTDNRFLYQEEVYAHAAEYMKAVEINPARPYGRRFLKDIAKRLSGPLYGRAASYEQAVQDILTAVSDSINAN